jgi:hypothetical protein
MSVEDWLIKGGNKQKTKVTKLLLIHHILHTRETCLKVIETKNNNLKKETCLKVIETKNNNLKKLK